MRLGNDRVQLIPFEPVHASNFYRWQLVDKYKDFFGNLELTSLQNWATLKQAYMIVDPKDVNKILGAFLLQQIDEKNRSLLINLLIDEKYQRKGIGTEAGKYMLWYIFNTMNFYKIMGRCSEHGIGTQKIFDKIGFKKEAHFRKHVIYEGEREDVLQYYIIKGPFNKQFSDELRSGKREAVAAA